MNEAKLTSRNARCIKKLQRTPFDYKNKIKLTLILANQLERNIELESMQKYINKKDNNLNQIIT